MTNAETSAFLIWILLIVVVAVVLDGGWVLGAVMALVGILIALLTVRRHQSDR